MSLSQELAEQALNQTRVVANGPALRPGEALHVDVIPGGSAGGNLVPGSSLLPATTPLDVLRIEVTYELQRMDSSGIFQKIDEKEFKRVPPAPSGAGVVEVLSAAFLLAPHVKFKPGSLNSIPTLTDLPVGLPKLDHRLEVTIKVSSDAFAAGATRTVDIPFSLPTIEIPLPVPPAVCICASDADLKGEKYLIMLPPGSPEAVGQIVSAYNSVLDALNALKDVLELISFALEPLKTVVKVLGIVPSPYVTTSARVQDFDDYNDFDDEMSSFLIVGPTGIAVRFSDTANPDRWDDLVGDNDYKKYTTVDILQLPTDPHGDYILDSLAMDKAKVSELAKNVATLSGVDVSAAKLGIGVMYVHDLEAANTPADLLHYDKDQSETVQDDTESAIWVTG